MTRTEYIQTHTTSFLAAALHITKLREEQAFYVNVQCDSEKKKRDIIYLCTEFATMQADVFGLRDENHSPSSQKLSDALSAPPIFGRKK